MACETVGKADCFVCGTESPVRMNKNKKLFIMCAGCGMIYPNTAEGQKRLKAKVRAIDESAPAPETKQVEPIPAVQVTEAPKTTPPPVESAPAPKPKKPSILDMLP